MMEFELTHYGVTIHDINYYAMGAPLSSRKIACMIFHSST